MIREIGTPLIRKSIIEYVEYRLLENIFLSDITNLTYSEKGVVITKIHCIPSQELIDFSLLKIMICTRGFECSHIL